MLDEEERCVHPATAVSVAAGVRVHEFGAKPLEVRHPQSRRISSDSVVVEVKFQQSGKHKRIWRAWC